MHLIAVLLLFISGCAHINKVDEPELFEQGNESIVRILFTNGNFGGGTGWATLGPSGEPYIITNNHVCEGVVDESGQVLINAKDGKVNFIRKVLVTDPIHDICVIEGSGILKPLDLGTDLEKPGLVYAVGHPRLMPLKVARGIWERRGQTQIVMSHKPEDKCLGKMVDIGFLFFAKRVCVETFEAIETNLVIYPGNSGSPVFNAYGQVVGLVFAGDNETHYGLYIEIKHLKELIKLL